MTEITCKVIKFPVNLNYSAQELTDTFPVAVIAKVYKRIE